MNFCLLIRGKPGAGKSTLAERLLLTVPAKIIDPDKVNQTSRKYKTFTPKNTKNPSENVKMYSFLFSKADKLLKKTKNVIWTQPWSRLAEIELTLRNFAYYHSNMREEVWKANIDILVKVLPFRFIVADLILNNVTAKKRFLSKGNKEFDKNRFQKTCTLFQEYSLDTEHIILCGNSDVPTNSKIVENYLNNPKKYA